MLNASEYKTILVIDDDASVRQSYIDHLEDLGYVVLGAENGRIGLNVFYSRFVDLVLVDLRMPEVSGHEVLSEISEKSPHTPLIVASGNADITEAVDALKHGAWDYLLKPIANFSVLEHAVENGLEKAQLLKENLKYKEELEILVETRTKELKDTNVKLEQEIQERRRAEEKVQKALKQAEESDNLKTEFINNMSHEIRTPLNGIMGFTSLLNDSLSDEKRNHYINVIQQSSSQLLKVINDILEISSLGTKQVDVIVSEIDVNAMLDEIYNQFELDAKIKNLELNQVIALQSDSLFIASDYNKVVRVLSNLIENALRFTTQGYIAIGYTLKDDTIQFSVKDTGIGISKEKVDIIFKRFSQEDKRLSRKYGGLGLGLSIAQETALLLGGCITVKSEKGCGSEFIFTVPVNNFQYESSKVIQNKSFVPEDDNITEYTILVAEDEELNFLFLKTMLDSKIAPHVSIIWVADGAEAVEYCENNNVDLILMDLKMPVMTGLTATRMIKKFKPTVPIIAQTAYVAENEKKKALDAGFNDYISKPINPDTLYNAINNICPFLLEK